MFSEIYYKSSMVTVGHEFIKKDLFNFLKQKNSWVTNQHNSIFEEHKNYYLYNNLWSDRKLWNFFLWFFYNKHKSNYEQFPKINIANVVFLDMLGSYKAWRHCRGYPVKGQRTWSNGKSCSKNNNLLKNYRLKQFQSMYGYSKKINYATLIQAECMNRLWLKTWPFEWAQGRKHAVRSKSRKGTTIPVDVINLSKGITTGYKRYGAGERWNSSKKALKTVTVGLPIFFSRYFFGNVKKKHFKYQLTLLQPESKAIKQKKKFKKKK